jgi:hypothetical protein
MLLRCPWWRDGEALREHVVAMMVELSGCGDPEVAREASRWLFEHGERLRSSEREGEEGSACGIAGGSGPWRVC